MLIATSKHLPWTAHGLVASGKAAAAGAAARSLRLCQTAKSRVTKVCCKPVLKEDEHP